MPKLASPPASSDPPELLPLLEPLLDPLLEPEPEPLEPPELPPLDPPMGTPVVDGEDEQAPVKAAATTHAESTPKSTILFISIRPSMGLRAMTVLRRERTCHIGATTQKKGESLALHRGEKAVLLACNTHVDRARSGGLARCRGVWGLLTFAVVLALTSASRLASADERNTTRGTVRVLVPDEGNLQLLAFYVALGARDFAREGVDVVPTSPSSPALVQGAFTNGEADVALLPAPVYERLIEERAPFVLVANLLQNDPIDLVVAKSVADERGLRDAAPLKERLSRLRGLRIGVAPHPRSRLVALFRSQGLDVEAIAQVVVVPGKQQDDALARGEVDALYAHTPFLENALVDQGAVVVANQSGGEVAALTGRQIHALAVKRSLAQAKPDVVRALVRAIARAESRIHERPEEAVNDVLRALPARAPEKVRVLVSLYAPAVPKTPRVSVEAIRKEVAFYPEGGEPPRLDGIDLRPFVASDLAASRRASFGRSGPLVAVSLLVLLLAAIVVARSEREG